MDGGLRGLREVGRYPGGDWKRSESGSDRLLEFGQRNDDTDSGENAGSVERRNKRRGCGKPGRRIDKQRA